MKRALSQLTIGGRLWIVMAVTGVCVAGLSFYSYRILQRRTSAEREAKLRVIVELGHGIVGHYGKLAESGALPKEEAQRQAMEALRSLRFDGGNYLFVYDRNVVLLMHPNLDLQGKSQAHLTDPTGKRYTVEFVRTAEGPTGEGTVDYLWPKPGTQTPVRKISHVKMYAPWGWIICAGLYLDDLDEAMAAEARRVALATALVALLLAAAGVVVARSMRRAVDAVCVETERLRSAVEEGQLTVRAREAAVGREFQTIVRGVNETMEAFAKPIEVTAEYLTRISSGDIPPPITDDYRGDFNRIKDALNRCIAAVDALVADATALARAGVEGKLSTRADAARHQGDFRKIVQGVNETLDAVVGPLAVAATCVDRIAKGDIPQKISADYKGDFDVLKRNLNTCIEAVNGLVADAKRLSEGAVAGVLSTRADASRHQGEFRAIIQGVNDAIEAIVEPFKITGDYLVRISHGEIPPHRTNAVRGDLVALQAGLNRCVDSLTRLVADADGLAQAAVKGELATRADLSRHEGAFRSTLAGVNRTLDAVIAPVNDASGILEQLARRDLRARVTGQYQGDHARIAGSVNAAAEALDDALAQVAQAVDQVTSAAAQIASSSQAVASGASEQASSLQETSASLESVAGMTKQTSDSAQQANHLAQSARAAAAEGSTAVGQMQGAMAKIRASAEGTSQIIRDINDIAFQTNLLALNAAVEAARAGEAGRGFAVVAEEVRSLALRAKEAASKTEELIRQSVKEAGEGEVTAGQVSAKLTEIAGGVAKLTDIVAEIAAAAREQSGGLDQVTRAVGEMDRVTQQNAASAEESSSAASELSGQAGELASLVGGFVLSVEVGTRRTGSALRAARQPSAAPRERTLPAPARGAAASAPVPDGKGPGKNAGAARREDELFPMDEPEVMKDF